MVLTGTFFIIMFDKTGTSVWDKRKEAIIAKATAMDSGRNMDLGTPDIKRRVQKQQVCLKG